jgi:hypothetical protein
MDRSKISSVSLEAGAAVNIVKEACSYLDHVPAVDESAKLVLRVLYFAREGKFSGIDGSTSIDDFFNHVAEAYCTGLFHRDMRSLH